MATKAKGISFGLVLLAVLVWALMSKKTTPATPLQVLTNLPGFGPVVSSALAADATTTPASSAGGSTSSSATSISGQTGVYGLDWY